MKKILFKSNENIYKANLHCHTTLSDGCFTPVEIKRLYMDKGYSIVAYTDHREVFDHTDLCDKNFLAINSCEMDICDYHTGPFSELKTYHFNLYATDPKLKSPPPPEMRHDDIKGINKYIKDMSDAGFLVCYNHPYWSLHDYSDYSRLEGCFAMEIYNNGAENVGRYGYNPQAYDEMLRSGKKIHCVSADDNHNHSPLDGDWNDSFGGFTFINSVDLKYGSVIRALKDGEFYSSQGPEIYGISLDGDKLCVRCSDVALVVVYTNGRRCYMKHAGNAVGNAFMRSAEFTLSGEERYVRVMCRDRNGKDANSNAYWLA